ncbi:hypothetical protein IQ260_09740 [Leptolyngbya cf. ectocarpi LEGE 11479]|uniref:Uncharacterized protein n=1 Tax=Leptolyngbya cf. ectocarpi LEGE 11479 TaxID=1828722 RepID=A0A928X376_LEPEC|nr:hypothetical protein [Leptolyngbya ectocarpi]MBE9066936.1 hypothetical protein [Leptolyngbya cf. ectocarpi LEGE 11479]
MAHSTRSWADNFGNIFSSEAQLSSFISPVLRLSILLVLGISLERVIKSIALLPQESYNQPVIFIELIHKLFGSPIQVFGMGLVFLFGVFLVKCYPWLRQRSRSLFQGWSVFDDAHRLRLWILSVAAILTWWFTAYDYNLFFNQAHGCDRILLLGLFLLIYWRPLFVLPFTVLLAAIIGQLAYPLGGYSWAAQDLLIRSLLLFAASFCVAAVTGYRKISDLIFITCCLIAAHYLTSGIGKLKLNWLVNNSTHLLLPSAYSNGWWNFLAPAAIIQLTQILSWLNWPMKVLTLVLECGVVFALWNKTTFRWFLIGWISLHTGIFLISGICFWHWAVLELIFFLVFFWRKDDFVRPIFTKRYRVISWVVILALVIGFQPVALAWIDSPIAYTYQFEAVGESGQAYSLSSRFFAPYDYQFILGDFSYLSDQPVLMTFGRAIFKDNLFNDLKQVQSLADIEGLETEKGRTAFDVDRIDQFDLFCQQFIGNWNRRLRLRSADASWLSGVEASSVDKIGAFSAPPLLWIFPRENAFTGQELIARINIYQMLSLYGETHYQQLRTRKIHTTEISTLRR